MYLFRLLTCTIFLFLMFSFFKAFKLRFMKYYFKFIETIRKIYRLLNEKKQSAIVWNELIKLHKEANWHFGQFENQKYIVTNFDLNDNQNQKFRYDVSQNELEFHTFILNSFDEDKTTDILVLASHFNSLLNFGKIRVNIKYNCVEYIHSGNLITYMLFPTEIHSDIKSHYNLTKDCCWAFTNLVETGEDPVFVFSELLRRKDNDNQANN